jgi:thymidylate synthase ThyX
MTDTALRVRLLDASARPTDHAVAAAMSCSSAALVTADDLGADVAARARRDRIAERTFRAGHHTTRQHAHFHFAIEGVSRYLVWAFLHDHPFHNSEQVSQRYVRVAAGRLHVPPLSEEGRRRYLAAAEDAFATYEDLARLLTAGAEAAYLERFPARGRNGAVAERFRRDVLKRAREVARQVLPIATLTHLHHTVSALTLHRYRRLARALDCGPEIHATVERLCAEVERIDPHFFRWDDDPLPLEESAEFGIFAAKRDARNADAWSARFDAVLGDRLSALVEPECDMQERLADAVRNAAGLLPEEMTDAEAIALVLDPGRNPALGDHLNLACHARLTRALTHVRFTFMKRLSLGADAQDQRHRAVPGSRPSLRRLFRPGRPDFVLPPLVAAAPEAEELFRAFMERHWRTMAELLDRGESLDAVLYLLPNAFPVRFEETGDLLGLRHKWAMRLCCNAQEEIRRASCEEAEQVAARYPLIGKGLLPPCGLRAAAERKPFCPEGTGFCGLPAWTMDLPRLGRVG